MGTRHEAREWALQFLFQRDFNTENIDDALHDFWAEREEAADRMKLFMEKLVRGVETHRTELDDAIRRCADNWDVSRMGAVDRNVMRIAIYEMLYCPDIPPVVSINEAVEIAKAFSSFESGRFVNGILDRALREIDRPHRTASTEQTPKKEEDRHGPVD
jgi:N utilization substance protein B